MKSMSASRFPQSMKARRITARDRFRRIKTLFPISFVKSLHRKGLSQLTATKIPPKKEIQLLEDIYKGVGKIKKKGMSIAGDHTDIDALMKRDLKNYKKDFTRINIISNKLNNLKGAADRQL